MTPIEPLEARLASVRAKFDNWSIDGLLIGSGANRRWLSGFAGSSGWLLVTADKALLGTDFRYWEQAKLQAPSFELFRFRGMITEELARMLELVHIEKLGIESQHITVDQLADLGKKNSADYVSLKETLEPLRAVKNQDEIAKIREAAAISDQAMSEVSGLARPGKSERQLAWELEKIMRESGADGIAFSPIVASGPNGAMAHHHPGNRELRPGDTIVVDIGAELDGYHSDITRTFFLGNQPSDKFQEIYSLVLEAQTAAIGFLRSGVDGKTVDGQARQIIQSAGYGQYFGHGLGHGVGLEIHEGPRLSPLADGGDIPQGAVVTLEPGVYIPLWGGIRIEDLVLVTDSGIEPISTCPKEPFINPG